MLQKVVPSYARSLSQFDGNALQSLRTAVDRIFDDFNGNMGWQDLSDWGSLESFTPRLDLEEKDDKIVLTAELPGMTDKDVQVELDNDCLTIKGEKKLELEKGNKNCHLSERSYGAFKRKIRLQDGIAMDKIDATVKDGALTLVLPKSAEAKRNVKRIPVHH